MILYELRAFLAKHMHLSGGTPVFIVDEMCEQRKGTRRIELDVIGPLAGIDQDDALAYDDAMHYAPARPATDDYGLGDPVIHLFTT